jgi:hypothetical protein
MTKGRRRSARRRQALDAQRRKERQQRLRVGGIAALAIAVLGGLLWLANRPKAVESKSPFGTDGTAWGPVDAPVLIEEWSDFN